jgi:bifunctional DNA primase/polymerase-like protein
MNPHFAAVKDRINDAAFWYWNMGISVIPCQGKKPNIPTWDQFMKRRATRAELDTWMKAGKFLTIGIICGEVSSNLVVMDLDGIAACNAFELMFPNLMNTYEVRSGSGLGQHLYYQPSKLPATTRVSLGTKYGFELRANGCYVIAPPSIHPDSRKPYSAVNDLPVMTPPDLEMVRQWIHQFIRHKYEQSQQQPPKPLPAVRPGKWIPREEFMRNAYLNSAIQQQVNHIIASPVGGRNNALYMSAQTLGQLIGGGELARGNIETMLLNAAITVGLSEIEAQRTIESGIDAGVEKPRLVPPAPPRKA